MSGCVRDIRTKNYQNLIIGFQVTAKNVGDVCFGTQCIYVYLRELRSVISNALMHVLTMCTHCQVLADCIQLMATAVILNAVVKHTAAEVHDRNSICHKLLQAVTRLLFG